MRQGAQSGQSLDGLSSGALPPLCENGGWGRDEGWGRGQDEAARHLCPPVRPPPLHPCLPSTVCPPLPHLSSSPSLPCRGKPYDCIHRSFNRQLSSDAVTASSLLSLPRVAASVQPCFVTCHLLPCCFTSRMSTSEGDVVMEKVVEIITTTVTTIPPPPATESAEEENKGSSSPKGEEETEPVEGGGGHGSGNRNGGEGEDEGKGGDETASSEKMEGVEEEEKKGEGDKGEASGKGEEGGEGGEGGETAEAPSAEKKQRKPRAKRPPRQTSTPPPPLSPSASDTPFPVPSTSHPLTQLLTPSVSLLSVLLRFSLCWWVSSGVSFHSPGQRSS